MNDDMLTVRLVGESPETRDTFRASLDAGELRYELSGDGTAPGLLVLEVVEGGGTGEAGENGEKLGFGDALAQVRAALDSRPAPEVFLVARDPGPAMLLAALRAGVAEVLASPLDPGEVLAAMARFRDRQERRARLEQEARADRADRPEPACRDGAGRRGAIIEVIGAKGGVGTTTLAVNLAASLAARGDGPVLAMDLNLAGGEVPLFLDLAPKYHWGEAFRDISRLDASFLMSLVARRSETLHVLAAPSSLDDLKLATPEAMSRLLELMRSVFSAVVIDGGQYLDEVALAAVSAADTVLLAMVQNLPCVASVKRFLQHLGQPGADQADGPGNGLLPAGTFREGALRLVVNRHLKDNDLTVADLEQAVGRTTFWQVPNDYTATLAAMNHGRTLAECAPKSPVAASLRALADALVPPGPPSPGRASRSRLGLALAGLGLFARLGRQAG